MDTDPFDRGEALRRLADEEFDVLVIGAGATGAGVALDAASRGLRTALVERGDFAAGTSSLSSKMIHGGIRYLQQLEIKLVYQSLTERQRLLANAPHLVRTLPFVMPIYTKGGLIPKMFARMFGLVLWFYDVTGGSRIGHRHRRLDRDETVAHMPTLRTERIHSGYLYYDAQVDDARMTMAIARTAATDHGAVVANHTPVVALNKDAAGRLVGATVDAGGGHRIEVRAAVVVSAVGVWIDAVGAHDAAAARSIRPARGVHVVVPRSLVRNDASMILPVPGKRSTVFAVPWGERRRPRPPVLHGRRRRLPARHLQRLDVERPHGGRCRRHVGRAATAAVFGAGHEDGRPVAAPSRDAIASGLVTVSGGKLTTWRRMAEHTVDEVLRVLGRAAPCVTKKLRLCGADGWDQVDAGGVVEDTTRDHLAGRFGAEAAAVIALVAADPSLGAPLVPGLPYLRAEAVHAARKEMVVTLDDLLSHRTRARLLARDASAEVAPSVAELLGATLGWSAEEQAAQVAAYREEIDRERQAIELAEAPADPASDAVARQPGWVPGLRLPRRLAAR